MGCNRPRRETLVEPKHLCINVGIVLRHDSIPCQSLSANLDVTFAGQALHLAGLRASFIQKVASWHRIDDFHAGITRWQDAFGSGLFWLPGGWLVCTAQPDHGDEVNQSG